MVKATLGSTALPSLRRGDDPWKVVCGTISALYSAGQDINWEEYHRPFSAAHKCLCLPTYIWDNKNFWAEYRNNWCLAKGETPSQSETKPSKPRLSTTSVQKIIEEQLSGANKVTLVTETDVCHPDMQETIKGHIVNGMALCSSAVYADMALTAAEYSYRTANPNVEEVAVNCGNMVVDRPLIVKETDSTKLLRMSCVTDLDKRQCEIRIYSVDENGKETTHHADCVVEFGDSRDWVSEWSRQ